MKPGAREAKVEKMEDESYKVWVTAVPDNGKANAQMADLLAEYFDVAKSCVVIVTGKKSREKVVSIIGISETPLQEK